MRFAGQDDNDNITVVNDNNEETGKSFKTNKVQIYQLNERQNEHLKKWDQFDQKIGTDLDDINQNLFELNRDIENFD